MYLYSTSTKLSIDVWLYLDRPGSLRARSKMKSCKIDWIILKVHIIPCFVFHFCEHKVCLMWYILNIIRIILRIITYQTFIVIKTCGTQGLLSVGRTTKTPHRNMTITLQYMTYNWNCNTFIVPKSSESKQCWISNINWWDFIYHFLFIYYYLVWHCPPFHSPCARSCGAFTTNEIPFKRQTGFKKSTRLIR